MTLWDSTSTPSRRSATATRKPWRTLTSPNCIENYIEYAAPDDRVYDLFQRLAGACPGRRPGIAPLFKDRVVDVPERDLPSGYGHSWATIAELRAVEDWPDSCGGQLRCAFLDWVRDEGSAAGRLVARHGADNVRVVFGFE